MMCRAGCLALRIGLGVDSGMTAARRCPSIYPWRVPSGTRDESAGHLIAFLPTRNVALPAPLCPELPTAPLYGAATLDPLSEVRLRAIDVRLSACRLVDREAALLRARLLDNPWFELPTRPHGCSQLMRRSGKYCGRRPSSYRIRAGKRHRTSARKEALGTFPAIHPAFPQL